MSDHTTHHEEHHKETFISKYVFSMDHKMIAKQYLITGIIMSVIGMVLSILFRIQLGWPDESFPFLEKLLENEVPEIMDGLIKIIKIGLI